MGWCKALKPRYKRLVDDIFPVNPQDGLVKDNMDKLTFYASSSPEKLDRIGKYLASKLSNDVARQNIMLVKVAMDALDQLLVSCHDYSRNLFVESFLMMVQKLLECDELDLKEMATTSFVKFANIEENTPSYHRRYDFFVSKFSSMCRNNTDNDAIRSKIRTAGLKGLQGVVRKSVSDALTVTIWEPFHMDNIVPSLLCNMHDPGFVPTDIERPRDEEHPTQIAEVVFRDLVCRAAYGNLKPVLKPMLVHMDSKNLWTPPTFVIRCFQIIMYSVQQQYAYEVIQTLMLHLDMHMRDKSDIRVAIVEVLYETVLIAAGASVGPSVLGVFNTLVKHLCISLDNKSVDVTIRAQEEKFEEAIIKTIGEFANNLPDYQKIEIMMFVMAKIPQYTSEENCCVDVDVQLQTMLLKTLLKVATKYRTVNMASAFPHEFLQPLLWMSLFKDPLMRVIVQEILHTLIDRHNNTPILRYVQLFNNITESGITIEYASRPDNLFMIKYGMYFYYYLLENIKLESNKVDNFDALFCTMCLITVEVGSREIVMELIKLGLDLQNISINNLTLPLTHKCAIHALVLAFLNFIVQVCDLQSLHQYCLEVLDWRKREAPHLLPEVAFNRENRPTSYIDNEAIHLPEFVPANYPQTETLKDKWLFQQEIISMLLSAEGFDISRLSNPLGLPEINGIHGLSDNNSINVEIESVRGSPVPSLRKSTQEVTVESLKMMLAEDNSVHKEEEERRRSEIIQRIRTAPFEEIVARCEAKSIHFHNRLNEIFPMVSRGGDSPSTMRHINGQPATVFDIEYPELYVY